MKVRSGEDGGSHSASLLSPQALFLLLTGAVVGSFSLVLIIFDWVNKWKKKVFIMKTNLPLYKQEGIIVEGAIYENYTQENC